MNFFTLRKARRILKKTIHSACHVFVMREDLLTPAQNVQFKDALARARMASHGSNSDEMDEAGAWLEEVAESVCPRVSFPEARSMFEMWVTALAVAMAFRAYFYQPFRIPTNSMYPTLYGVTSVDEPRDWADEALLFKVPKWLLTGSWHKEIRAKTSGQLLPIPSNTPGFDKPGYNAFSAGGEVYYIPSDVVTFYNNRVVPVPGRVMNTPPYAHVQPNQLIWAGRVTLGDFVFVNRWIWNFRRPQTGEVMVFSTQGINGLQQGTHYIKRMCGVPGDKVEIIPPNLYLNGAPFTGSPLINLITSRGQLGPWAAPYAGYTIPQGYDMRTSPFQILNPGDTVQLDASSYYALGDNSRNSLDSRYWGVVPEKNLLGPGAVVYWPFINNRWGKIR